MKNKKNNSELHHSKNTSLDSQERLVLITKRLRLLCIIALVQTAVHFFVEFLDQANLTYTDNAYFVISLGGLAVIMIALVITYVVFTVKLAKMFYGLPIMILLGIVSVIFVTNLIPLIILFFRANKEAKKYQCKMDLIAATVRKETI